MVFVLVVGWLLLVFNFTGADDELVFVFDDVVDGHLLMVFWHVFGNTNSQNDDEYCLKCWQTNSQNDDYCLQCWQVG